MAQRVQVLLVDDLDGSDAEETVTFGLDGVTYEIDLNEENAAQLRDELATWIGHARRAGGRRTTRTAGRSKAATGGDTAAVREWARSEGYTVSDRGRISAEIREAYEKAHH